MGLVHERIVKSARANPKLGHTTKEEFIKDAVRFKLTCSSEEKSPSHSKM